MERPSWLAGEVASPPRLPRQTVPRPSPKKRNSTLPAMTIKSIPPLPLVPSPAPVLDGPSHSHTPSLETVDEPHEESSADSEAGPSSISPAPQTPSRAHSLPPPLTDDPIVIHSPYDEPPLYPFLPLDPDFAYEGPLVEMDKNPLDPEYVPSPFDETLLDLASLGILSPRIPSRPSRPNRTLSFSPFESDPMEASSIGTVEEEPEQEQTGSRFDFAKMPDRSVSVVRGQSPFTVLRRNVEPSPQDWPTANAALASGGGRYTPVEQRWGDAPRSARGNGREYMRSRNERDDYEQGDFAIPNRLECLLTSEP